MIIKKRIAAAIALVGALSLTACGGGSSTSSSGSSAADNAPATSEAASAAASDSAAAEAGKKYKVALSMSYSGNDWQAEAQNLVTVTAAKTLKDQVSGLDVFIAGTDAQNQISQLQQMIADEYDAIVIYPISPTALNQVIKQGCDAGIVMMTYDSTVTEPCAHNVTFDQAAAGKKTAEALADMMGNKGNVVLITGVAGTTADEARTKAAEAVFQERGINVLGKCAGDWASGPSGKCMSQFLASFDNIDGVWAQAGGPAILDALDAAGKDYMPITGESENQWRLDLADPANIAKGLQGVSYGSPPYQGAAALQLAIDSLVNGTQLDPIVDIGFDYFTQDQIKTCDAGTVEELEAGCNAFTGKQVPPGFFADWYSDKWTKGISLDEVLTGKPAA
jgi:ribose transport system substrate-binding protein